LGVSAELTAEESTVAVSEKPHLLEELGRASGTLAEVPQLLEGAETQHSSEVAFPMRAMTVRLEYLDTSIRAFERRGPIDCRHRHGPFGDRRQALQVGAVLLRRDTACLLDHAGAPGARPCAQGGKNAASHDRETAGDAHRIPGSKGGPERLKRQVSAPQVVDVDQPSNRGIADVGSQLGPPPPLAPGPPP